MRVTPLPVHWISALEPAPLPSEERLETGGTMHEHSEESNGRLTTIDEAGSVQGGRVRPKGFAGLTVDTTGIHDFSVEDDEVEVDRLVDSMTKEGQGAGKASVASSWLPSPPSQPLVSCSSFPVDISPPFLCLLLLPCRTESLAPCTRNLTARKIFAHATVSLSTRGRSTTASHCCCCCSLRVIARRKELALHLKEAARRFHGPVPRSSFIRQLNTTYGNRSATPRAATRRQVLEDAPVSWEAVIAKLPGLLDEEYEGRGKESRQRLLRRMGLFMELFQVAEPSNAMVSIPNLRT